MPDIAMCGNKECYLKESCHRFTAIPDPVMQWYGVFKPDEDGKCEDFLRINHVYTLL